jgi:nicotinamide riboside transporter PnuC
VTKTAAYIGFAARLAGHWSNGHFIAVVLHLGWTYSVGLLFVNLYFYIFNQQRFWAGRAMNSSPAASPARYA